MESDTDTGERTQA